MNLIDKDLLLTKLTELELKDPNFVMGQVKGVVEDMIVIEERKHGHWVDDGSYITTADGSLPVYTCSVCKKEIVANDDYDCCPCCMAIMDEEVVY